MAMPKLYLVNGKASRNTVLLGVIVRKLNKLGYECDGRYDIIRCIEQYHVDVSQFEFPDGNYELFKENFLLGK